MSEAQTFISLYAIVLQCHRRELSLKDDEILKAIEDMQDKYSPHKWKTSHEAVMVNFNNPAYRCGYLHKYASFHTDLVKHVILDIVQQKPNVFWNIFHNVAAVNICSLGGGPGTEVIGISSVFSSFPSCYSKPFHFTVVDSMPGWSHTFSTVLEALSRGNYGNLRKFITNQTSTFSYLSANLLSNLSHPVKEALHLADIVTMVKFVSAAASKDTVSMLKAVFSSMKTGALFLFIDNAAGGFYELVDTIAQRYRLQVEYGPVRHKKHENKDFKLKMFGIYSLSHTTVAIQLWRKTGNGRKGMVVGNSFIHHDNANLSVLSKKQNFQTIKGNSYVSQQTEYGEPVTANMISSPNSIASGSKLDNKSVPNSSQPTVITSNKCHQKKPGIKRNIHSEKSNNHEVSSNPPKAQRTYSEVLSSHSKEVSRNFSEATCNYPTASMNHSKTANDNSEVLNSISTMPTNCSVSRRQNQKDFSSTISNNVTSAAAQNTSSACTSSNIHSKSVALSNDINCMMSDNYTNNSDTSKRGTYNEREEETENCCCCVVM